MQIIYVIGLWLGYQIQKSIKDVLQHDYKNWKSRFGIPDKWDFWFNPAVSWQNKYRSRWWNVFTPFSDAWHTIATIYQIAWVIIMIVNWGWWGLLFGVTGVYVVFNGIYAFLRRKQWISIP